MAQPIFALSRHTRFDLFDSILQSLNAMPEVLRKTFILSHYHGKSKHRIAYELDVDPNSVPSLLSEANARFFEGIRSLRVSD